jgi:putative peptide zinc metalloprotease protein
VLRLRATYSFKILGIFLFIIELAWFVVMPIWRELKVGG